MKKNTMFKIIAIMAMVAYVLSWIIPAASASGSSIASLGLKRVSLYNIIEYPYLALQFFLQPLLFILAVGGLYGVLSETGKYRNKLEKIAKSMKGKETLFLVLTAFVLAALSSVFGLNLMLFILTFFKVFSEFFVEEELFIKRAISVYWYKFSIVKLVAELVLFFASQLLK